MIILKPHQTMPRNLALKLRGVPEMLLFLEVSNVHQEFSRSPMPLSNRTPQTNHIEPLKFKGRSSSSSCTENPVDKIILKCSIYWINDGFLTLFICSFFIKFTKRWKSVQQIQDNANDYNRRKNTDPQGYFEWLHKRFHRWQPRFLKLIGNNWLLSR